MHTAPFQALQSSETAAARRAFGKFISYGPHPFRPQLHRFPASLHCARRDLLVSLCAPPRPHRGKRALPSRQTPPGRDLAAAAVHARRSEHDFHQRGRVEAVIVSEIAARPSAKHLILVMSSVSAIDSNAVESMEWLAQLLRPSGLSLHLSDVKGPVMDRLHHSHLLAEIVPGKVFLSVNAAAEEFSRQQD